MAGGCLAGRQTDLFGGTFGNRAGFFSSAWTGGFLAVSRLFSWKNWDRVCAGFFSGAFVRCRGLCMAFVRRMDCSCGHNDPDHSGGFFCHPGIDLDRGRRTGACYLFSGRISDDLSAYAGRASGSRCTASGDGGSISDSVFSESMAYIPASAGALSYKRLQDSPWHVLEVRRGSGSDRNAGPFHRGEAVYGKDLLQHR